MADEFDQIYLNKLIGRYITSGMGIEEARQKAESELEGYEPLDSIRAGIIEKSLEIRRNAGSERLEK